MSFYCKLGCQCDLVFTLFLKPLRISQYLKTAFFSFFCGNDGSMISIFFINSLFNNICNDSFYTGKKAIKTSLSFFGGVVSLNKSRHKNVIYLKDKYDLSNSLTKG